MLNSGSRAVRCLNVFPHLTLQKSRRKKKKKNKGGGGGIEWNRKIRPELQYNVAVGGDPSITNHQWTEKNESLTIQGLVRVGLRVCFIFCLKTRSDKLQNVLQTQRGPQLGGGEEQPTEGKRTKLRSESNPAGNKHGDTVEEVIRGISYARAAAAAGGDITTTTAAALASPSSSSSSSSTPKETSKKKAQMGGYGPMPTLETAALPCIYKDYGCNYLGTERANHEKKCMFRPIPCLLRSYKTDKECFQRGKDAAYFLPWCQRFYYVSISKRGDLFHLAALWFAISPQAAQEADRKIKMDLVFPLDNNQILDEQISELIQTRQSFIVPIRRWRREWSESKHKCYFQVRARWTDPKLMTGSSSSSSTNTQTTSIAAPYTAIGTTCGGGAGSRSNGGVQGGGARKDSENKDEMDGDDKEANSRQG
eukprot:jgi/Bigna1/145265/aug1.97_g19973